MVKILIEGWLNIPHSYSIVCNNLVRSMMNLHPQSEFYYKPVSYYREQWENCRTIDNLELIPYDPTITYDAIFRISFRFIIEPFDCRKIVIFYTFEDGVFHPEYFDGPSPIVISEDLLKFHFTTPSRWSQKALKNINISDENNVVISHGINPKVFRIDIDGRRRFRDRLGIGNEFVIGNVSAMTGNKGIEIFLRSMYLFTMMNPLVNFSIVMKGSDSLYGSSIMANQYLSLVPNIIIDKIKFIGSDLSNEDMNDLYNGIDLLICPYIIEGFCLPPLEALASGCPVIVSRGASDDYVIPIRIQFPRWVGMIEPGKMFSEIILDYIGLGRNFGMSKYVHNNYNWGLFAEQLYQYLLK